jgi:hypothetical protein
MLAEQLAHLEYLEEAIAHPNAEVSTRLHPFEAELEHLDTFPGIARAVAEVTLAELGTDGDMAAEPFEAGNLAPGNVADKIQESHRFQSNLCLNTGRVTLCGAE